MPDDITIGSLRWPVTLATRSHEIDQFDDENHETRDIYAGRRQVWANITPVGTQAFLAGKQLENGLITHRVTIRWKPTVARVDVVLRSTTLPDGGSREDVYHVHRMAEWQGKNRWLVLECELESRDV